MPEKDVPDCAGLRRIAPDLQSSSRRDLHAMNLPIKLLREDSTCVLSTTPHCCIIAPLEGWLER
jgi:hypothetical protein